MENMKQIIRNIIVWPFGILITMIMIIYWPIVWLHEDTTFKDFIADLTAEMFTNNDWIGWKK